MKLVSMGAIGVLALVLTGCQSGNPQAGTTITQAPVYSQTQISGEAIGVGAAPQALPRSVAKVPAEPGPDSVLSEISREALAALERGQLDSSIALAEQGLRIDRRHASFYLILSKSYLALGDLVQAQRFADQASRLCARDCRESEQLQKTLRLPK